MRDFNGTRYYLELSGSGYNELVLKRATARRLCTECSREYEDKLQELGFGEEWGVGLGNKLHELEALQSILSELSYRVDVIGLYIKWHEGGSV